MRSILLSTLTFLAALLMPSLSMSATLLGPMDLKINNWHYHTSFHAFRGENDQKGIINITKRDKKSLIHDGFVVLNFKIFSLKGLLKGDDKRMQVEFELRRKNRLFIFLRGKPSGSLSIEVVANISQPSASITAEPQKIILGESSTLIWQTEHADSIRIEPAFGSVAVNGSHQVSPVQTTTYTLTVTGPGGVASSQTTIEVQQPLPEIAFSPEPAAIAPGESSTLIWSPQYAESCSIDQGIGGVGTAGTIVVSPTSDTLYTFTARGQGGTAQAQLTVMVTLQKIPIINKPEAHYKTPENTIAASSSAVFAKDLEWYNATFTEEALTYQNQLFSTAGIKPLDMFERLSLAIEQYVVEKVPYKDGILVVTEIHYNDTDGTILRTAAGLVEENGLWKITHKYSADEEVARYDTIRFVNCIAGYNFHVDSFGDSCLHENDLTLTHNTQIVLDHRKGGALTTAIFNGTDSALGGLLNDLPEDKISIGGWIKAQQVDQEMTVVEIGSSPENGITIMLDRGPGILYRAHLGNADLDRHIVSDYDFRDWAWHHLYLTYDGNHLRFYVDGELKDTVTASGAINADTNLNIGQSNGVQGNPSNHFKGMIDDLQIFNIALTKEQVVGKMTPDYR